MQENRVKVAEKWGNKNDKKHIFHVLPMFCGISVFTRHENKNKNCRVETDK